jgi:hypothetical protein
VALMLGLAVQQMLNGPAIPFVFAGPHGKQVTLVLER